jgi:hypothetical protein
MTTGQRSWGGGSGNSEHVVILRRVLVAVLGSLLLSTAGCGDARNDDVESAARRFHDALDSRDGVSACELLAPPTRSSVEQSAGMPCSRAIVEEQVGTAAGPGHVEVYGTMGQVRWTDETTFLTRYRRGWRVLAAGCALQPGTSSDDTNDAGDPEKYECSIEN